MNRETRYLVLKFRDFDRVLTVLERKILMDICAKVADFRAEIGKPPLACVVVESDWPEYEPVWKMIEARVAAQPAPDAAERERCSAQLPAAGQCALNAGHTGKHSNAYAEWKPAPEKPAAPAGGGK